MASSQPPRVGEVGGRTLWKSKAIPQLGLEANLEFEYRVYVLECRTPAGSRGPFYYVGIAHRSEVGKRIVQHFNAKGAFYTKANPPQDIHLIWPAAHTAVEGFVFLALLATLRLAEVGCRSILHFPQILLRHTNLNCFQINPCKWHQLHCHLLHNQTQSEKDRHMQCDTVD